MKVHLGVASLKVRCHFLGLTRIAIATTIIITIIIICRVSPHHVVLRHWNSESETSTLILKFSFQPSLLKCESDTSSVKVIRQENMTSIARGLVTQKKTLCTIDIHWLHSSARLSSLCGHFWIYHKFWSLWQARSTFPAFAKLELQQGNFGKQKWNARQPLAQWLIVRTGRHHVTSINISVYWICTWNILSNLATVNPPKSSLPLVFFNVFFLINLSAKRMVT